MSGRTNKVCATLSILAKPFLLPASQKQDPNLPVRPAGAVSPKLHLLLEAHLGFSKRKMGPYEVGPLELPLLVFTAFFKEENRWDTHGCARV